MSDDTAASSDIQSFSSRASMAAPTNARQFSADEGRSRDQRIGNSLDRTWRQICAAMSLCGRPAAEKSGIFCPRAMEFMVSIVEMPVCARRRAGKHGRTS